LHQKLVEANRTPNPVELSSNLSWCAISSKSVDIYISGFHPEVEGELPSYCSTEISNSSSLFIMLKGIVWCNGSTISHGKLA
jgi:hypothetical protein